jgi:hypothetical protein
MHTTNLSSRLIFANFTIRCISSISHLSCKLIEFVSEANKPRSLSFLINAASLSADLVVGVDYSTPLLNLCSAQGIILHSKVVLHVLGICLTGNRDDVIVLHEHLSQSKLGIADMQIAFHRLPSPSIAFHRLPSPSIAFHRFLSLSIAWIGG